MFPLNWLEPPRSLIRSSPAAFRRRFSSEGLHFRVSHRERALSSFQGHSWIPFPGCAEIGINAKRKRANKNRGCKTAIQICEGDRKLFLPGVAYRKVEDLNLWLLSKLSMRLDVSKGFSQSNISVATDRNSGTPAFPGGIDGKEMHWATSFGNGLGKVVTSVQKHKRRTIRTIYQPRRGRRIFVPWCRKKLEAWTA